MLDSLSRTATWLAAAALAGPALVHAQSTPQVLTCDGPTRTVHVKASGDSAAQFAGVATQAVTSFSNTSGTNFFLLPLSGVDEYVDYGVKTAGLDGQVTEIRLSYITEFLDPSVGGAGASLDLSLYSGSNGGCDSDPNSPGTLVRTVSLTGLPGSLNTPFGEIIEVVLDFSDNPIALPDGAIGWGFRSPDVSVVPRLVVIGEDPTGTKDFLDNFNAGTCFGPVSFEFNDRPVSSLFIELTEGAENPQPCGFSSYGPFSATQTSMLTTIGGDGPGDLILFNTSFALLEGTGFLIISEQPAAISLPGAEILVDLESQLALLTFEFALLGQTSVTVPNNPELAGLTVFCQSAAFDPNQPSGMQLSNGLRFDVCP